jgi:hypothetical protein
VKNQKESPQGATAEGGLLCPFLLLEGRLAPTGCALSDGPCQCQFENTPNG